MPGMLASWSDGPARRAVVEFVEGTVAAGVPGSERVAVFDNDGTLWCEKPMPIQADFIVRRLAGMAQADRGLCDRQPWKAASERDFGWFGQVLAEHYAGDDTNVAPLLAGILAAWAGISVEEFEAQSEAFLRTAQHPTLGRGYLECAYAPMIELLGYLEANGFANFIASGGGRDFMRPISQEVYGVSRDRVIGSAIALEYVSDDRGGTIMRKAEADYLDDGPAKAGPDLEPHRPPPGPGGGQLQRRHPHAGVHPAPGQAIPPAAAPPRRQRARVRLHQRRRAGPGGS